MSAAACYVSRQCDEHARQLGAEEAEQDAIDRHAGRVDADYGWRLRELATALAGYGLDEDAICIALAEHRARSAGEI